MKESPHHTLDEMCSLTGLTRRTVRYYIQLGLVPRPVGTGRGAHYTNGHLERLLEIKKWKAAGLSLERIQDLASPPDAESIPEPRKRPGDVEVWSRIFLAPGLELHVEPRQAGLSPEAVRELAREAGKLYEALLRKGKDYESD